MDTQPDIQKSSLFYDLLDELNQLNTMNEAIQNRDIEKINELRGKKAEIINQLNTLIVVGEKKTETNSVFSRHIMS